jgi:hypothetical protein
MDEAKADSLREKLSCEPLDNDSLGILEENIKDLYDLARKTKPRVSLFSAAISILCTSLCHSIHHFL